MVLFEKVHAFTRIVTGDLNVFYKVSIIPVFTNKPLHSMQNLNRHLTLSFISTKSHVVFYFESVATLKYSIATQHLINELHIKQYRDGNIEPLKEFFLASLKLYLVRKILCWYNMKIPSRFKFYFTL